MPVHLVPAVSEHVPEIGRIAYEAFKDISDRHHFPPDFPDAAFGRMITGMLVAREDVYGVTALSNGEPFGSNFLATPDDVGGVGPITVECSHQGEGIGRALMEDVLRHARDTGVERVRLVQDSFNMTSLALYASLGFETKHPLAYMTAVPNEAPDPTVRPATERDLAAVAELSTSVYKVSRRNDVAAFMRGGPFQPFVRERGGRVVGYFTLGPIGHGVAETQDDMLALVQEAARLNPPEMRHCFCPLREGDLYRKFLEAGFRNTKVMNLMTLGPYDEPDGVWMPSVVF